MERWSETANDQGETAIRPMARRIRVPLARRRREGERSLASMSWSPHESLERWRPCSYGEPRSRERWTASLTPSMLRDDTTAGWSALGAATAANSLCCRPSSRSAPAEWRKRSRRRRADQLRACLAVYTHTCARESRWKLLSTVHGATVGGSFGRTMAGGADHQRVPVVNSSAEVQFTASEDQTSRHVHTRAPLTVEGVLAHADAAVSALRLHQRVPGRGVRRRAEQPVPDARAQRE